MMQYFDQWTISRRITVGFLALAAPAEDALPLERTGSVSPFERWDRRPCVYAVRVRAAQSGPSRQDSAHVHAFA